MQVTLAALFAAHALLIGINDYTASHLKAAAAPAPGRDWPDLTGAVNDVHDFRDLLIGHYGFAAGNVTTLTDQQATREAILGALRSFDGVQKGDTVFFYYAGHGSQVRNSKSDEPDKLDESIVPADSRRGAPDIRDKDLRRLFNAILDRGTRLTVMIDACHSGSGARGLPTGAHPRGVAPDLRDVADGGPFGPRPENRGALILSASQDFDSAWETHDEQHRQHGAFTWAWMRSLRAAASDEPAMETFLRAQARLGGETPFQNPVCAGTEEARRAPFLGVTERAMHAVVAIQRVQRDGTVVLAGGWANGLSAGTELRTTDGAKFVITSMDGLVRSTARLEPASGPMPPPGTLLEIAAWAAPPAAQLDVWVPRTNASADEIRELAIAAQRAAVKRGVRWIVDPAVSSPEYVVRWDTSAWELLHDALITRFESPVAAVANVPPDRSLFLQLPVPAELADAIQFAGDAVVKNEEPHYILTGRLHNRRLEYAWVRPGVSRAEHRKTSLPARSVWLPYSLDDAEAFEYRALCLHKILAWNELESPPRAGWPYRLDLPDRLDGARTYSLTMRAPAKQAPKRYVYVFAIDSYGQSNLLFPVSGSVENRFPIGDNAPSEVELGHFRVTPPYGVDTYFLLTTEEPLANPWVLQWDGIRGDHPKPRTALEQLLAQTSSATRSPTSIATPVNWSIERVLVESVPLRRHKAPAAVSE